MRKAKGLLAFLALQPDRAQARDKLAALLWAESAQAQARQSLRQALAGLRKALPEKDLLITDLESAFQRVMTQEVERHRGQLLQLHQDGAIAVFGMCRARSDDTERAVRTAVATSDRRRAQPGGQVRVALACGQALCELKPPQLTGTVLHQVRELLRSTATDQINATNELYLQSSKWIEAEPASESDPRIWRIQGIREQRERATTPLIGRRHELALLRATLEACVEFGEAANRHPAAVLLRALLQRSEETGPRELTARLESLEKSDRFPTTALRSVRRILAPLDSADTRRGLRIPPGLTPPPAAQNGVGVF